MLKRRCTAAAVVLSLALAAPASADLIHFFGHVDGSQEVPPTGSPGTGTCDWVMDTASNTISYHVQSQGTNGSIIAQHFHGMAPPGQNANILHNIGTGNPASGMWFYLEAQEADIIAGLTYVNVHTTTNSGGEIRGQNLLTARVYCSGDGTGTACPCNNAGGAGEGCKNSSGSGGVLAPFGSASVGLDDMRFDASSLLPGQPALLFAGLNAVNNGDGVTFGDGLRCAGGSVVRLGVRVPDAQGEASWGPGLSGQGGWSGGDRRFVQAWYRDPNGGPCGFGFNLSNGLDITFAP